MATATASTTRSPGDKLFLILAAWFVPGLGHVMLGQKRLGGVLLALLGGSFLIGLMLSDFTAVSRDLNPWSFFAQAGLGGGALPLLWLDPAADAVLEGSAAVSTFQPVPPLTDSGVLFCNIAGLLNLLVVLDAADRMFGGRRGGDA
ncbi:MAG: DUF6677 family protein [Planctomycetota bacterium]